MSTGIDITLTIPMPPRGKQSHRSFVNKKTGRAVSVKSEETRRYEATIMALAQSKLSDIPQLEGCIRMDMLAVLPRPEYMKFRYAKTGAYKYPTGLVWAPCKPDRDNIQKSIKDALKPIWTDDAIVVSGEPLKVYAEANGQPRVVVRLRSEDRDPQQVWSLLVSKESIPF
jgi:Holliday junction resolvase RusA-like endonuclease